MRKELLLILALAVLGVILTTLLVGGFLSIAANSAQAIALRSVQTHFENLSQEGLFSDYTW